MYVRRKYEDIQSHDTIISDKNEASEILRITLDPELNQLFLIQTEWVYYLN